MSNQTIVPTRKLQATISLLGFASFDTGMRLQPPGWEHVRWLVVGAARCCGCDKRREGCIGAKDELARCEAKFGTNDAAAER
jgi:hypothetical protein